MAGCFITSTEARLGTAAALSASLPFAKAMGGVSASVALGDYNDVYTYSYDYSSYSRSIDGYDAEGQLTSAIQYVTCLLYTSESDTVCRHCK